MPSWLYGKIIICKKRERKERLLNEIIDWAVDTVQISWSFGKVFKEAIKPVTEREQQLFKYAHIAEVKERFMQFVGRNVYITAVASSFTKSLQQAIQDLGEDLGAYIKFLDDWQRELQFNIKNNKSDKEENSEKADEHVRSLNKSAIKVIEEATKIKTKDIGKKEEDMSKEGEATGSNEPTLKDIEEHLKRQDRQTGRAIYFAGASLGASIILVAVSLWIGRFTLSASVFYLQYIFLIVVGFGVMLWCWWKQSKVK